MKKMANTHFSKAKLSQKSKKMEDKKVAPPGFEPGSLDALTIGLRGKGKYGAKNQGIYS